MQLHTIGILAIQRCVTVRFHTMRQVGRRLHPDCAARSHKEVHVWPTKDQPQS